MFVKKEELLIVHVIELECSYGIEKVNILFRNAEFSRFSGL